MMEAMKNHNGLRARRAAVNMAKGVVGATLSDAMLIAMGIPAAYGLFKFSYSILQPAISITKDMSDRIDRAKRRYANNEITLGEWIDETADAIFDASLEFIPVPTKRLKRALRNWGSKNKPSQKESSVTRTKVRRTKNR